MRILDEGLTDDEVNAAGTMCQKAVDLRNSARILCFPE